MSEKKSVSRTTAIMLGVICIILAICLAVAVINYQMIINEKDKTIASLNNQISNLQSQVDNLNSIVSLKKVEILEKDKTVNLPAGGHTTFYYSTPYSGYIRIDFTASGPVYFRVYNPSYGYSIRYPESGTETSGRFIVPVLPGTTYVYIEHPALLIGASVTFTITYVY